MTGHTVTAVTIFTSLLGRQTKARMGIHLGLQGKRLGLTGREAASNHRMPIPKRLFAYTQITVRLYANSNAIQDDIKASQSTLI